MLQHTFLHLPRVGPVTERRLWEAGITTWEAFLREGSLRGPIQARRDGLERHVVESRSCLQAGDAAFFRARLPPRERWRMYGDFRETTAFLDIETTGLSPRSSHLTVVGVLGRDGYRAFVWGEDLEDVPAALERYDLVVTYNGASFDLPYLAHHFGRLFARVAHLDLRAPLRRLGYVGGLKAIERQMAFARPSDLAALDGYDAVLMWRMWEFGDAGARDTLVAYNAQDVTSLVALADAVYARLAASLPVEVPALRPWDGPMPDLPYDADVVRRLRERRMRLAWA